MTEDNDFEVLKFSVLYKFSEFITILYSISKIVITILVFEYNMSYYW